MLTALCCPLICASSTSWTSTDWSRSRTLPFASSVLASAPPATNTAWLTVSRLSSEPGLLQTDHFICLPATASVGSLSGAYWIPIVGPWLAYASSTWSATTTTLAPAGSTSFADAMFSTWCSRLVFLSASSSTTYRVVDCLPWMMFFPLSQPTGALGLNAPQIPKPVTTSTPTTMLGSTALTGRGASSSLPPPPGSRKAPTVRLRAKV